MSDEVYVEDAWWVVCLDEACEHVHWHGDGHRRHRCHHEHHPHAARMIVLIPGIPEENDG